MDRDGRTIHIISEPLRRHIERRHRDILFPGHEHFLREVIQQYQTRDEDTRKNGTTYKKLIGSTDLNVLYEYCVVAQGCEGNEEDGINRTVNHIVTMYRNVIKLNELAERMWKK